MKHIRKQTKIKVLKTLAQTVIVGVGVASFFIGIGALGEIPTDPKKIVQALGMAVLGISIIAINGHLVDKENKQ